MWFNWHPYHCKFLALSSKSSQELHKLLRITIYYITGCNLFLILQPFFNLMCTSYISEGGSILLSIRKSQQ